MENTRNNTKNFKRKPKSKPTTIYIGNLSYQRNEGGIKKLFTKYGKVISVNIVKDKKYDRSKGIAFVRMPDAEAAKEAIHGLNGQQTDGRKLKVSVALERDIPVAFTPKKKSATNEEVESKTKREKKPVQKKKTKGLDVLFDYLKSK